MQMYSKPSGEVQGGRGGTEDLAAGSIQDAGGIDQVGDAAKPPPGVVTRQPDGCDESASLGGIIGSTLSQLVLNYGELVPAAMATACEDERLPAASTEAGGVTTEREGEPGKESGQQPVPDLVDTRDGERGFHGPLQLIRAGATTPEEDGDEALARARGPQKLRDSLGKLSKTEGLEKDGADQQNGAKGVPRRGQVGALDRLNDSSREGSLNNPRAREKEGNQGSLPEAQDELRPPGANVAGDPGDSGEEVTAKALLGFGGVIPTVGRG